MKRSFLFALAIVLTACSTPTPQVTATLPPASPTPEPTVTPEPTATPEPLDYSEIIKNESHIETVEMDYKGVPVKINIVSHESITGNQFVPMEYVYLDPDKTNRYGETSEQALAHAVLQGLAQAWENGATSDILISALKSDPTIGVPVFASKLDEFPEKGYNPQDTIFHPINQQTGKPNEINIVFMEVSNKEFPGKVLNITGIGNWNILGISIDNNGNLYLFRNAYIKVVAYTKEGLDGIPGATARSVALSIESLSWAKGNAEYQVTYNTITVNTPVSKILTFNKSISGSIFRTTP